MLAAIILAATASATDIPAESARQLVACVDAAGAVDLVVKDCYVALAHREDARLNTNWKRLMRAVGGKDTPKGKALIGEQKAWLSYRDAACLHWTADGGTLDRVRSQICYTDMISTRANEVADYANTYEETYSTS